jgi:hypothetical protein
MLNGLYKVEVQSAHGSGRGVAVARDGKIFGGNAAFAFAGHHQESGGDIALEISVLLRNEDLNFKPVPGAGRIALQGRREAEQYIFEGSTIKAVMTAISEEAAPPAGVNGADGIGNGLYSLNIRMLDGVDSGNTGLMVLHDGSIRGGDAFFDYVGAYSSANGRWKGELINHEHTPTHGARPLFGGREVGIGFTGTYNDEGAEGEAVALAGKRSIRFKAVLRKLAKF